MNKKFIKVNYLPSLGSFLDEKNIKWRSFSESEIIIYYTQPDELFIIGVEYQKFYFEINETN